MDQSRYGHNAGTNVVINQYSAPPTLVSAALNGMPVVNFNGSQLLSILDDTNLEINGDMTVCLCLSSASTQLGDPISKTGGQGNAYTGTPAHGYTNNMPGPFDIKIASGSGQPQMLWGNPGCSTSYGSLASGTGLVNQYYIVSWVVRGTNITSYVNGSYSGTTSTTVGVRDAKNPMMLGVRADSGNPADAGATLLGNLAEVMVIRGTVTPVDLNAIHNYMGNKYAIPIVALAINEQPASTTVQAGQQATFWINAVGLPPVTYQWKSNNVAIAGATSSVYTTPNLSLAANNASYTVTVTTAIGSTNSAPATLTVLADNTPPTVFSATQSINSTNIVVVYSEAVSSATALNAANYSLNGGPLLSAVAGSQSNQVILTGTAPLSTNTASFLTIQNVQDLFANTIATTNVLVLPAGLSLWLSADAGVVTDINGNVVRWLDKTANTNNATQYAGGPLARPTPQTSAINGKPALLFNSPSGNYLQAATSPSLAIAGDLSIYVVLDVFDYSAPREFLGKTLGNQPASYDYYASSATDFRLYRGNGTVSAVGRGTASPSTGLPHVIAFTMRGTNVNHYMDGNPNGAAIIATNMGDGGTALDIGSRNDLAQFMNGDIAEVMIFSNALSASDRTNIDNYLGVKYFPLTAIPPASVTTNEGVTVTLSVTASQGSAHLAYQWQESTTNNPTPTNIPNATNASYTTGILAPGDNGDTFDVLITAPGGSTATSSSATVTVNDVPPAVVSAGTAIWNPTQIVVVFSEAVTPATATNINNYSLTPGASILSAVMGDAPNKVILTTSPLAPGTAYSLTVQNVMDLYNNTIVTAAGSVGVYPASVAMWLKADQGVTVDGNGYVTEWDDQTGNANNMTQPGGDTYAPLLVPNAINGMPALYFETTNNFNYMFAQPSASLAITGDMSVFAVMNFSSLTNGPAAIISKATANLPSPYDYYVRPAQVQLYRGNGAGYGLVNSTVAPSTGVPHLLGVLMQGTTVTHLLDGSPNGSGTLSTAIADNASEYVYIGARDDGTNLFSGQMAELIVLGAAPSSNDTVAIESYLATKYSLLLAPSFTQQPVAATNVDQDGTLVVPVGVAGASPLSFQWYDTNNVAVPGQTNATLVISNIAVNNSYYLHASNVFGSTNSAPVAVTLLTGLTVIPLAPASLTNYAGTIVIYSVTAFGTAPFYYQWFADGAPVASATNSTYALVVQPGDNTYSCTVSNDYHGGTTASSGSSTLVGLSPSTNLYRLTVLSNNPIAYWRLDESNGSTLAIDHVGGHTAAYNNVQLGVPGYNPPLDPDTAAAFGLLAASDSYAGEIDQSTNASPLPNIDFAQPSGGNAALSVEAWVKTTNTEAAGAGIVTKGWGGGGEQFDLDVYTDFRFFVRDATNGVHGPTSSVVPVVGQWYHVVGVWDGANGAARLYINGVQNAAITNIATGLGLLTATPGLGVSGANLVSIGARTSASSSATFNLQFQGVIDEVALYNYALSPSQVQADYQIGNLLLRPSLSIVNLGGGHVQLLWNAGTLQSSTNVAGPYNALNATSPYSIPASNGQQFYRVLDN